MLTATGADVDGDTLTYTWEQMDNAATTSPPVSTNAVGALFRSYKGSANPSRTFRVWWILSTNANPTWEKLPSVARTMNFRVVARDNDWQAGCTDEDDVKVTVSAASGPFLVTAQYQCYLARGRYTNRYLGCGQYYCRPCFLRQRAHYAFYRRRFYLSD